jgi:ubiquitin-conjugating enzyme E2 variant
MMGQRSGDPSYPFGMRPRFVVIVEWVALAAGAACFVALAARVATASPTPRDALLALASLPLGVAVADLLSGIVHWACDTFLEETTPVVGPLLIAPFREHHRDPTAIVRHGFVERNGHTGLAAIPIACVGLAPGASFVLSAWALGCSLAVLATNQLHAWAHAESVPRAVRWLQRHGAVLSPAKHAAHHRAGDERYCVTTGWTSVLLDRTLAMLSAPRGTS